MTGFLVAGAAVALAGAALVVAIVAAAAARGAQRHADLLARRLAHLELAGGGPQPRTLAEPTAGLEESIALHWFTGIGALVLLVGVGFCFEYAVDAGWIRAEARVGVGLAAGALVLGAAERLRARVAPVLLHALAAVGLGVLYLSTWAACALYRVAPAELAYPGFTAITLGAGAAAVRYRAEPLLVLALIGGLLAPAVIDGGPQSDPARWVHLLVVCAAAFTLAVRLRFITAAVLALVALDVGGGILLADHPLRWAGATFASAGLAFTIAGAVLFRRPGSLPGLLSGQGAVLLAVGLGVVLPGPWPTLTWAALGIASLGFGRAAGSPVHRWLGLGLLAIALSNLLLVDVWRLGRAYRTAAFLGLGSLLLGAGFLSARRSPSSQ